MRRGPLRSAAQEQLGDTGRGVREGRNDLPPLQSPVRIVLLSVLIGHQGLLFHQAPPDAEHICWRRRQCAAWWSGRTLTRPTYRVHANPVVAALSVPLGLPPLGHHVVDVFVPVAFARGDGDAVLAGLVQRSE